MDCPICTGGKGIPTIEVKQHLEVQHQLDKNIAALIADLNRRIETLE